MIPKLMKNALVAGIPLNRNELILQTIYNNSKTI
jgi:hypothetical protein